MTITEIAMNMYPFWILGIIMMVITYFSQHRELLRVQWKEVGQWAGFLALVTFLRFFVFYVSDLLGFSEFITGYISGASIIPWQVSLTVFWEDALHAMPVAILARMLGSDKPWKKWVTNAAIGAMMISFGLGHTYQGVIAALALSFYIPFTFKKGQEIGFGTVMLCHMMYDLVTILTVKNFLG